MSAAPRSGLRVDPGGRLSPAVLDDLARRTGGHFGVSAERWIVERPA